MIECPDCRGKGEIVFSHVLYADGSGKSNVPATCARCGGRGEVPEEMLDWIFRGAKMRDRRIGRNLTLRAEAARRGMSPTELSKMEMGKIEPVESGEDLDKLESAD